MYYYKFATDIRNDDITILYIVPVCVRRPIVCFAKHCCKTVGGLSRENVLSHTEHFDRMAGLVKYLTLVSKPELIQEDFMRPRKTRENGWRMRAFYLFRRNKSSGWCCYKTPLTFSSSVSFNLFVSHGFKCRREGRELKSVKTTRWLIMLNQHEGW